MQFLVSLEPCRTFFPIINDTFSLASPPPPDSERIWVPSRCAGASAADPGSFQPGAVAAGGGRPTGNLDFEKLAQIGRPGFGPAVAQAPANGTSFENFMKPAAGRLVISSLVEELRPWRYAMTLRTTSWLPAPGPRFVFDNVTLWAAESLGAATPAIQRAYGAAVLDPFLCYDPEVSDQACASAGQGYLDDIGDGALAAGTPRLAGAAPVPEDPEDDDGAGRAAWVVPVAAGVAAAAFRAPLHTGLARAAAARCLRSLSTACMPVLRGALGVRTADAERNLFCSRHLRARSAPRPPAPPQRARDVQRPRLCTRHAR